MIKPITTALTKDDRNVFLERLERLEAAPSHIVIGMEATSWYHENLYYELKQRGYQLRLLHPGQTHHFHQQQGADEPICRDLHHNLPLLIGQIDRDFLWAMGAHSKSLNKNASFLPYPRGSCKLSGTHQGLFTACSPLAESIEEFMSGPQIGKRLAESSFLFAWMGRRQTSGIPRSREHSRASPAIPRSATPPAWSSSHPAAGKRQRMRTSSPSGPCSLTCRSSSSANASLVRDQARRSPGLKCNQHPWPSE